ncbi:hypothetical protein C8R46DRAFT_1029989 [Mycena filopes]|nr:hypothetical protein C8R46DRAFT_1029989 [Mycena filopes]
MTDFNFQNSRGVHPNVSWFEQDDLEWCSIGGESSLISSDIRASILLPTPPKIAPISLETLGIRRDPDFQDRAARYSSQEHWLGWMSTLMQPPEFEDPAMFVFDRQEILTNDEYVDLPRPGGGSEDYDRSWVGTRLDETWTTKTISMSRRLQNICVTIASSTEFYGPYQWVSQLGDMPNSVDEDLLCSTQYTEKDAQDVAKDTRRTILSQIGFISWFCSVYIRWNTVLSRDDVELVRLFRLSARAKRGTVFNLTHDRHEINFYHFLRHDVSCHYAWTSFEAKSPCFIRYSPRFWGEYLVLRRMHASDSPVDLTFLPSYTEWKESLERFDVFFQDAYSGRSGKEVTEFKPTNEYFIVDFLHWGARPLQNRLMIRAYSLRFKAVMGTSHLHGVCTFIRQNPRAVDEPAEARPAIVHEHPLTDFATELRGRTTTETEAYYESTYIIREQAKNRWAPREGRTYNTFNGHENRPEWGRTFERLSADSSDVDPESKGGELMPEFRGKSDRRSVKRQLRKIPMSPTRRSEMEEDLGISGRWARGMARSGRDESPVTYRRRSSRSLSPVRRSRTRSLSPRRQSPSPSPPRRRSSRSLSSERSFHSTQSFGQEFHNAGSGNDYDDTSMQAEQEPIKLFEYFPDARGADAAPQFATKGDAIDALEDWSQLVLPDHAPGPEPVEDLYWALLWIEKSYLVCKDERTLVRMKAIAARRGSTDFLEILNLAVRYGLPFGLHMSTSDIREFKALNTPALERLAWNALYAPGYVDTCIAYGKGGAEAYARYLRIVADVLCRPNAIGFIFAGGILSFIAQLYDPDLFARLRQGPSAAVTEYNRGVVVLASPESKEFLIGDGVSPNEESLLVGHAATGDPSTESWLWPHPDLLEKESRHARGVWSEGLYQMFENLRDEIQSGGREWRTRKEWVSYFRGGNKGKFAPKHVPSKADFAVGTGIIRRSFPVDWNYRPIRKIVLPEVFEPLASRD